MPTKVQEDAVTLEKNQLMKVLLGREEKMMSFLPAYHYAVFCPMWPQV